MAVALIFHDVGTPSNAQRDIVRLDPRHSRRITGAILCYDGNLIALFFQHGSLLKVF